MLTFEDWNSIRRDQDYEDGLDAKWAESEAKAAFQAGCSSRDAEVAALEAELALEKAAALKLAAEVVVAQTFHELYEEMAPRYGYNTRKESAVPWEQVPENNRRLMENVCAIIRDRILALISPADQRALDVYVAKLRPDVVGASPICLDCNKAGIINCSHFDNCDGKWVYKPDDSIVAEKVAAAVLAEHDIVCPQCSVDDQAGPRTIDFPYLCGRRKTLTAKSAGGSHG